MNTYTTLIGEKVDLDSLPAYLARVPEGLLQAYKNEANLKRLDPFRFAERARSFMGVYSYLITPATFVKILRGGTGVIYRDCFYRLLIAKLEKEKGNKEARAEFRAKCVVNLRYNPLRILFDRFLDGWATFDQFGEAAGLDIRDLRWKLQSQMFSGRKSPITLELLAKAFENLGIIVSEVWVDQRLSD